MPEHECSLCHGPLRDDEYTTLEPGDYTNDDGTEATENLLVCLECAQALARKYEAYESN